MLQAQDLLDGVDLSIPIDLGHTGIPHVQQLAPAYTRRLLGLGLLPDARVLKSTGPLVAAYVPDLRGEHGSVESHLNSCVVSEPSTQRSVREGVPEREDTKVIAAGNAHAGDDQRLC